MAVRDISVPQHLPRGTVESMPAAQTWFRASEQGLRVNTDWFDRQRDLPVEVEGTDAQGRFTKSTVPLSFFARFLNASLDEPNRPLSLYLAQFPIPDELRPQVPLPYVLSNVSLSNSTLWLGVTPTRTPLHEDSNHNLLHQLVGTKVVRLLAPDQGKQVFESIRTRLGKPVTKFRGEEMMSFEEGGEGTLLEDAVWNSSFDGLEISISEGESLLIPRGWWHAVRGLASVPNVQSEIVASVNYWYR